MSKIKSSRSLFIYTALIFVVAILMIIIAFFGQSNLQKSQPIPSDAAATSGLTERAEQLSEDNRILLEQNNKLKEENRALREENESVSARFDSYSGEINNNNLLLEIYNCLYNSKKTRARELLETVNIEELTETQKTFYDILVIKSK